MKFRINTVFFAALCLLPLPAQAAQYGVNLLLNGNAEAGPASSTGAPVVVPGWTTSAGVTVIPYGAPGGFPMPDDGPPDAMNQFFAGGNASYSTATQSIDVSANAADIDAGRVVCDLSGWLGGFADQEDNAMFLVDFESASMVELGTGSLGPVTAADRLNITQLVSKDGSVPVPAGTRSITVLLVMQRVGPGPFNDGYADSLSVVLRGPVVVTNTADSGPGTLRDAFGKATSISFDPQVFNAAKGMQTITLFSGLPIILKTLTISGPGANLLTVRRTSSSNEFTIFTIDRPSDFVTGATVVISGLTITNGKLSNGAGGAIDAESCTLTVRDCFFYDNSAFSGGAIYAYGSAVELNGCTFFENSAGGRGGAFANGYGVGSGTIKAINCTISGNTNTGGQTGVINNAFEGGSGNVAIIVSNSTITGNTGAFFQEHFSGNGTATISLDNTIIAGNGPFQFANDPSHPGGHYISNGYNLSSNSDASVLNQTGDRNNTDPTLGPLQNNGGGTLTHALLPGSPAIDKGNTALANDQRGDPRPVDDPNSPGGGGNNSDIGAFEFQLDSSPTPTPPPTTPAQPLNVSTRLRVQTGENVMIGGFIITGSTSKKVIIRALGPSLANFGLTGVLDDPTITLNGSGGPIASNDNWRDNQQAALQSSGVAPVDDRESAILATLLPGSYTAVVQGKNQTTGIGVVEMYDLDTTSDSRLANISTRGLVETGNNILIGGFILGNGSSPAKIVLRAIGPSLTQYGVNGALANPTLDLRDANGDLVRTDDDWKDSQQAEIQSTGLSPTNDLESAIIATLPPGAYTALVSGKNGTTGVGLVEVYQVQ